MKKLIFSTILLTTWCHLLFSQQSVIPAGSQINVEVSTNNEIIYIHKLQKGQTIYSLARFFKMPVQDLMFVNNIRQDQIIAIDSEIKIPIDMNQVQTSNTNRSDKWIPIIYKVKKGETLYSIAKNYFPQRIDFLIARNQIQSFFIQNEQSLTVGWWGDDVASLTKISNPKSIHRKGPNYLEVDPKSPNPKMEIADVTVKALEYDKSEITRKENEVLDILSKVLNEESAQSAEEISSETEVNEVVLDEMPPLELDAIDLDSLTDNTHVPSIIDSSLLVAKPEIKTIKKEGIGLWDKNDPDATNLFVMHRTAKINSFVQLYNPVTDITVTARVIGHIIDALYPADIDVIVTKGVANKLGARDSRFRIEMQYYIETEANM